MQKDHYIVSFSIVRFPGGNGEKLVHQLGKVSYIAVFPTPEKHIFPGVSSSSG